ncbi:MAG: nuclear transport factor 2 family protein [Acidimicrobiia bacterium]|nr:nuclear transport factor 2 family protein [Acidimicrobiia bacterium]
MRVIAMLVWAGGLVVWGAGPAAAQEVDARARQEVERLPVCYARGTDAIGRASTAPATKDLNATTAMVDPNFRAGLEYYRRCFAPSFTFTLSNRGKVGTQVPDPATRKADTDAALQWANYVNNAFRGPGYVYTQHHMGSIWSDIDGDEGTVQSYLIATHVYGPESKRTGVSVVYGTYTDKVVRVNGRWLIAERTLDTFSSVPIAAGQ